MTPMCRSSSWAPFAAGYFGETEMVDLAATLARLLNINQPAACEGRPIREILAAPTAGPGVSTRHRGSAAATTELGRVVPIRLPEPPTARRVFVADAPNKLTRRSALALMGTASAVATATVTAQPTEERASLPRPKNTSSATAR